MKRKAPHQPSADLLARLSRLGVTQGVQQDGTTQPPDRRTETLSIETVIPGKWHDNEHGRCYVTTLRQAAADRHGNEILADALDACTTSLAKLAGDPSIADLDVARTAFLDTETTGLSGGTGTYAFLIGVGRFVGPSFQVRQFFMDDPSQEPAQLAEVAEWMADCTGLVTFNGRTFDMPLLAARYRFHALSEPAATVPHLDLLPLSRRLWRRRLQSCTLGNLEERVLGLERHDDVPGALIPPRYFLYQRAGDARPLAPVFKHNAVDILSMVTLLARAARSYRAPEAVVHHEQDWLSLARTYADRGELARAMTACETALSGRLGGAERYEAEERLAAAAKRAGDWQRAVAVWQAMTEPGPPRRLLPLEELAKYHEHRAPTRRPGRALEIARHARELVAGRGLRPRRGRRRALAELDHRIQRLERKIAAGRK